MRMFPGVKARPRGLAAITAAAALLLNCGAAANQNSDKTALEALPSTRPSPGRPGTPSWRALRAALDETDRVVALRALQIALNRVGDGGAFVWHRKSRGLKGIIRPTVAFRNADGDVCRHLIYALSIGEYVKQIEGIACRDEDGRWRL